MTTRPGTKPVTIRFTHRCYEQVRKHLLRDEFEELLYLFAHVVEIPKQRIFLVDHQGVMTFDPTCYLRRTGTSIVLDPRAKNVLYSRFVESPFNGLINAHSHPFETGAVGFSGTDNTDDLSELAYQYEQLPRGKRSCRNPTKIHALSMVLGQKSLDARGYTPGPPDTLPAIEQVQVLGERLTLITPTGAADTPRLSADERKTYDRQIRAFGIEGQRAHSSLRVGLVGGGGIGSILGEGLGRQGVRDLVLIDPDRLDATSLNRWQGARPSDVGKLKVRVLARRLRAMFPQMRVTSIAFPLTSPRALKALKGCDVLLSAVDNHLARFLLNRLSVQFLIPYLDAATAITKGEGENTNRMQLLFRLAVVVPGVTSCLHCSQLEYYDFKEIAPHLYDPATRAQLLASGYIQDHPEIPAPAVMSLNMLAASALLIELLNLVTSFHPLARCVGMDWLHPNNMTLRSDSENFPEGPSVNCLSCSALLGRGDTEPLPMVDDSPATYEYHPN